MFCSLRSLCIAITADMLPHLSRRSVTVLLGLLSFAVLNAQRVNISLAIEVMTTPTVKINFNESETGCGRNSTINATDVYVKKGTFDWNSKTVGYILSSSFVGFFVTQLLGGRLAEALGAKKMVCLSLLCASICNIVSPVSAAGSVYLLIAVQVIKGMAQGILQPAVSCLMACWYPQEQRSFLSSLTYSGFPAGALIGGLVSGYLCSSDILGGWPSVFYVFGFAGIILVIFVALLIHNSPEEYDASKKFQVDITTDKESSGNEEKKLKTPWMRMTFSIPTMALLAGMLGQYWMTFYFISVHSAYLSDVLNLPIKQNGIYLSLPYILQMIVTWLGSFISDYLTKKNYASTTTVRKYCNTLGCLGFICSTIGVIYAGCNVKLNIVCFFISMASVGLGFPGSLTVPMDLTKNFAGTLVGLSGTFASTSGFILPVIVGYVITDEGNLSQWSTVNYISIGVVLMSAVVFHVFGKTQLQDWDDVPVEETQDQERNVERFTNISYV